MPVPMPMPKAQARQKLAFLTGASSGIGEAAAALIEGYSASLDHEMGEFGVRIAVIEPAATRTSFAASTNPSDTPLAVHDASRAKYLLDERVMSVADTAESAAGTIVQAACDKIPRLRYSSGKAARRAAFARRFVPPPLFDQILRSQFGLA